MVKESRMLQKKVISTKDIISIASIGFLFPFIIYFLFFHNGFSHDDQSWSNFGSFIGGIGATVFSFASFILLIISNRMAKEEKYAEEEIRIYFELIELLNMSRNNLLYDFANGKFSGVEVINKYNGIVGHLSIKYNDYIIKYLENKDKFLLKETDISGDIIAYEFLRDTVESFTNIAVTILNHIDSFTYSTKNIYYKIFISILSNQEKTCLVINKLDYFIEKKEIRGMIMSDTLYEPNKQMITSANMIEKIFS
jgi:hypothetical protein